MASKNTYYITQHRTLKWFGISVNKKPEEGGLFILKGEATNKKEALKIKRQLVAERKESIVKQKAEAKKSSTETKDEEE